jgi:hypothetical protein
MMIPELLRAEDSAINMGEVNGVVSQSKHKYLILGVVVSTFFFYA